MMYPFMELPDGTNIEHSQIITEKGKEKVVIYFERDTETRMDAAKCEYPAMFWNYIDGFTKEEVKHFEELIRENAALLPAAGRERKPITASDGEED